ncbi:histone-lysine N-methyltransferase SETMAR-like [Ornithodoros turicata]|uniref:histone-lysine N-methyltransferase SETMAR-like n=1 Tax=Ornithodoros turicata TaxID=34597 RepID=UPI003138FBED
MTDNERTSGSVWSRYTQRREAFEWWKRFRDGRSSVQDDPGLGGSEPSVSVPENIQLVERLIFKDRRITSLELARKTGLSVGTLKTITHEHLQFRKVSARWVPRQLSVFDRQRRLEISQELRVEASGLASSQEVPKHPVRSGITINSAYYCQVLSDVHKALKQKRPGLISKGVLLLQDNARPHTAHPTARTLQELGWELLPHPPYSPGLASSNFHLFGPLKAFLGGRHFS